MSKVDGLVLPAEFRATSEGQNVVIPPEAGGGYFPGGPWYPGIAKPFEATGLSKKDALALIKKYDLPFKEAKADPLPADHFDRTGGMLSGATGSSETLPPAEATPVAVIETEPPEAPAEEPV